MSVTKTLTITEDQDKWVKENHIRISKLLQEKIEEERAKRQ